MIFYELALRTPPRFIFAYRVDREQKSIEFSHPDFIEICVREAGYTKREYPDGSWDETFPGDLTAIFPDASFRVTAGEDAHQRHSTFAFVAGDPFRRFDSEEDDLPLQHLRCRVARGESALIPYAIPLGERYDEVLRRIQRIGSFVHSEESSGGISAIAECYALFALLSKIVLDELQQEGTQSVSPSLRVYAERVARLLRERYRQRITVSDLAEEFHLSEGYVHRLFKKTYGVGPIEYLNRYRVDVAVSLMSQKGHSLAQAAREVGVDDASYMSRLFKRVKGVSVRRYFREAEVKKDAVPLPLLFEER